MTRFVGLAGSLAVVEGLLAPPASAIDFVRLDQPAGAQVGRGWAALWLSLRVVTKLGRRGALRRVGLASVSSR